MSALSLKQTKSLALALRKMRPDDEARLKVWIALVNTTRQHVVAEQWSSDFDELSGVYRYATDYLDWRVS
jgi:hypothetical protein